MVVIKINEVPNDKIALRNRVRKSWRINPNRLYNQSEVLAKELCRRYNLSLGNGFLQRTRNTPRQATLDADERKRILKNAFAASPDCMGKAFLLVDDVRTREQRSLNARPH